MKYKEFKEKEKQVPRHHPLKFLLTFFFSLFQLLQFFSLKIGVVHQGGKSDSGQRLPRRMCTKEQRGYIKRQRVGSPRPAKAQALRLNSGRDGGVHRRSQSSPLKGNRPRFCLPGGSTYALDVSPSQGDARLPPAVATISSPQGCSVGTVFSHKHLERAGVQPRHLVPERQAQVP